MEMSCFRIDFISRKRWVGGYVNEKWKYVYPFGAKIARFNISQFNVIKINYRVQVIIDKAEFIPVELFFVI